MGRLQIDILGASFAVQASEDDIYLKSYYENLLLKANDTIKNSSHLKDPVQISIMAGISLVDELYKEKQRNISYSNALSNPADEEANKLTSEMISKLNKVLA